MTRSHWCLCWTASACPEFHNWWFAPFFKRKVASCHHMNLQAWVRMGPCSLLYQLKL